MRGIRSNLSEYLAHVKMFSRNARLYLVGSFLMSVNFAVFQLLFNLYLREYGFSEGDIGLVNSGRALGLTLMALPAAMLLTRIRLKPVLLASCVVFALFSLGLTVCLDLLFLIGFALLAGMAFAFFRVASGPFYMRNSTRAERTHLFSFSFAMMILASMGGSAGSGNLVAWINAMTGDPVIGYRYTLCIAIVVGLLSFVPFAMIKASAPSSEETRISLNLDRLKRRGRFYLKITAASFLLGSGAGLIIPFLNLYFRDRLNLSPDWIGWCFFAVSCSMFVGTLSGPLLTKRFGLVRTIVFTQLASIPFMLILSYSYLLWLVVVAFIIRGGLMNLSIPINTNFCMEVSEKNEQGQVNALLMISGTGSRMIAVAIGGYLIEAYGYTVTLNVAVTLYIISSLTYYFLFRRVERRSKDATSWLMPEREESRL